MLVALIAGAVLTRWFPDRWKRVALVGVLAAVGCAVAWIDFEVSHAAGGSSSTAGLGVLFIPMAIVVSGLVGMAFAKAWGVVRPARPRDGADTKGAD